MTPEFCRTSLVAGTSADAIRYHRGLEAGVRYVVAGILDGHRETIGLRASTGMPVLA